MDEQTILYLTTTALVPLLALLLAGTYGAYSIAVIALAILTILLILVINYADFVLFPLLTTILGYRILPAKDYVIPKKQNCVIKNVSGLYYATGYITANLYNYVFTMEQEETNEEEALALGPERWERIIMSVKFPFKYHMLINAQEVQSYREELEGKLGVLEFRLSKEMSSTNPSQMAIDDYNRKINIIKTRIDRLSSGERPVGALMYIETTAVGVSEKAAVDALENQINQLRTVFNSLDISIARVVGRELYYLFKFNYLIPVNKGMLSDIFITQR